MTKNGNKIIADKGKVLWCTYLERDCGQEVSLGYIYYNKDMVKLDEPYLLTENDFEEITDPRVENPKPSDYGLQEKKFSYADAKAAVVKVYYSYDDQIALMLNYEEYPDKYADAYQEMQQWREVAGEVAKKLVGEE